MESLAPESVVKALVHAAAHQFHLSVQALHCTPKLARTIGDLTASNVLRAAHEAEAIQSRARQVI